ncbi:MAG: putative quinol monooxygenase [Planctomycetaceae bacterium]
MIHVIATIDLHPGTREAFLREFRQIVAPVRAEAGCLEYSPTVDAVSGLPIQLKHRADVITVVERWESLDHLQAHLAAPHMIAYRPKVKPYVRSVTLQILEPI